MTIVVYFDTKVFAYLIPVSLQLPNIQGAHFPHGSNKSHLLAIQVCWNTSQRETKAEPVFMWHLLKRLFLLFFLCVYVFSSTPISSLTCLATSVNRKYVIQQFITCDLFGQHGRGGRHLWGTSKSPWIKLRGGAAKLDGINRYKRYLLL